MISETAQYPLITGGVLLIVALLMTFFPPKKINAWYGYRTPKSRKNQKNWDKAQKITARFLLILSFHLLILGLATQLFGWSSQWIRNLTWILFFGGTALLIYYTESQLK